MFQRAMFGVCAAILSFGVASVGVKGNQEPAVTTEQDIFDAASMLALTGNDRHFS